LGGDFQTLESYELDQLKQRATINFGPQDETFEALPSKFLDATVKGAGKNFSAEVRTDLHIATDLVQRFVSVSTSTSIQGTGYADYLKSANTRVEVQKTPDVTQDQMKFTISGEFSKPWYIPEGIFLSEARSRGPAEFSKVALKLSKELSANY